MDSGRSPPDHAAELDRAIQDHKAGRLAAAEATYLRILSRDAANPDALHLLGMLACDQGDPRPALRLIDAAIQAEPTRAAFHNTRARALAAIGDQEQAEQAYRTAWSYRPDSAEIANNLGCLLRDRGDLQGAVAWLGKAVALAGQSAEITCNLADALAAQDAVEPSEKLFRHALQLRPTSADTHEKFGRLLMSSGRVDEAADSYRAAIRLRPDHAPSHNNLGLVLQDQGDSTSAMACFQDALRCDPHCADAHYNLGCLLLLDGRTDDARTLYERAIAADPLHGAALWARCMAELPILYSTAEQIPLQRARYSQRLAELVTLARTPAVARALAASAGASQPFFLPYQGFCDRALQTAYGSLLTRLLNTRPLPVPAVPAADEPIRIGIVSGFFRDHTIWRLMLKGWLAQIDPSRFQIHAYHTSTIQDEETGVARRLCPRFAGGRGCDIEAAIRAAQPHILLYPELGMDRLAVRLAAQRLAPVQCVAWGQPETSGLPTIDYFLSSALMEPDGAASHYAERLVRLPNLGIHALPDTVAPEPLARADLGLRPGAVVFWCGQALYKYLPQYDDVFARIAAESGDCQFLFIGFAKSPAVTRQFKARLRAAFAARSLSFDRHCVFLDPMPQPRFLGTIRLADVMLDSIGWSGGKSTLDALSQAPVIVTHTGPLMRGRHTMAILRQIGVTETIAGSVDDYVRIAVGLARDPRVRLVLRDRMAGGRHRPIADLAPIRAMEAFFTDVVRGR